MYFRSISIREICAYLSNECMYPRVIWGCYTTIVAEVRMMQVSSSRENVQMPNKFVLE